MNTTLNRISVCLNSQAVVAANKSQRTVRCECGFVSNAEPMWNRKSDGQVVEGWSVRMPKHSGQVHAFKATEGKLNMANNTHICGGTILVGSSGEQEHQYCDSCAAYTYDLDGALPSGMDAEANRAAWDAGDIESPCDARS